MTTIPELIYCANGNKRFAQIAIDAGYTYGAQLPGTVYFVPEFVDQDWKKPNRGKYMDCLAQHRPRMATVLDLEHDNQLPEVLAWAEEAAQYVTEAVLIIPKAQGIVSRLPRVIAGKAVRLAYSVPTRYGGSSLPLWDFSGWPVHLLGGNPAGQMKLANYMNIISVDGNMPQKMALSNKKFWTSGKKPYTNSWTAMMDGGTYIESDAHYAAFEKSCRNIIRAWRHQWR